MRKNTICEVTFYRDKGMVEVGCDGNVWTTYFVSNYKFNDTDSVPMIPVQILNELAHAEDLGYRVEIKVVEHYDR